MAFSDLERHTLSVEVRGTRKKAGTYKPGINTQLSSEGELSHGARTQTVDHGSVSLVLGVPGEGVPVPLGVDQESTVFAAALPFYSHSFCPLLELT